MASKLQRPKPGKPRPKRWVFILAAVTTVAVGVLGAKWAVGKLAQN